MSWHRSHRLGALAATCVALWAGTGRADTQSFDKGSLIIPMSASFQTPCGVVSAYGLVWRILQANQTGHLNAAHPVTVYWSVNLSKTSPNRCVPTNLTAAPTPSAAGPSLASNHWDDPKWNDGCDFSVVNNSHMPSVRVDSSTNPSTTTGLYPYGSLNLLSTTSIAVPAYSAQSLSDSGFNTVQYGGGPFVIDSTDLPAVLALLRNGDPSAGVPASQLSQYTTACTCGSVPSTSCHAVEIHQATAPFTVTVGKRMNQTPPKIAVLDAGVGVKWCTGTSSNCGSGTHVLDTYLANAGLAYVDSSSAHLSAGGCPAGSRSNCTLNGSSAGPTGTKYPGLIYDQFNAYLDLISTSADSYGLLNRSDARNRPLYPVFWTPHWETDSLWNFTTGALVSNTGADGYPDISGASLLTGVSYATYQSNGDGATSQRQNALNNVAHYLDRKGTGMMGECASIGAYEGSWGGVSLSAFSSQTQFMYNLPGVAANLVSASYDGRNCTDPGYVGGQCMLWPSPANLFSQIGDWEFILAQGTVQSFGSHLTGGYKPGVNRLAVTWYNYAPGLTVTNLINNVLSLALNLFNGWDVFTSGQKDNDSNKGTLLYVGGHEYTQSTVGNRLVLNTLMNLGYDPVGNERALTPPIGYVDPNYASSNPSYNVLITGLYKAVQGYPSGSDTYTQASGSRWYFPYFPGEVRAHQVAAISGFESQLADATLWAANDAMPAPGARNLFTYLGGRVLSSSTTPALSSVQAANTMPLNGALQYGWRPQQISSDALSSGSCLDVLKLGKTPEGTFGLVPGSDAVCDLQEAAQYTPLLPGADFGAAEWTVNRSAMASDLLALEQMLQTVRGYCFATSTQADGSGTPVLHPTVNACNSSSATDTAVLGGIVSSTPAVVGASPYLDSAARPRPTLIYAGGYDGQLHALYLSGGAGYTGPTVTQSLPLGSSDASSTFSTNWTTQFASGSVPDPGTELWSFLPASQLPLLRTNTARITSPPAVMDAFVDLLGTGIREWHTILVASTDNEVFALDVSNPLKPFLLWDVVGSLFKVATSYPAFSPDALADLGTPALAYKWSEPTARFQLPPSTLTTGRTVTGVYDFSDFGGSEGVSIAQARSGLQPLYAAYVTSSFTGTGTVPMGLEVFAIDLATGQKLWQWEEPYTQAWTHNSTPSPATLLRGVDGVGQLFVGDMEGRVWALDATTGVNLNNANGLSGSACPTTPCNYPAFDARSSLATPQPISTNINISLMPAAPASTDPLVPYAGAQLMTFGTAGEDWVYLMGAPVGSVAGRLHVLLADARYQVPYTSGTGTQLDGVTAWTLPTALAAASNLGVYQEAYTPTSAFPLTLGPGGTVYGTVSTFGQMVTFGTSSRPLNDLMSLSSSGGGSAHLLDLGLGTDMQTALLGGIYGGFAVGNPGVGGSGTTSNPIFGLEAGRVVRLTNATTGTSGTASASTSPNDLGIRGQKGMLFQLKAWLQSFTQ